MKTINRFATSGFFVGVIALAQPASAQYTANSLAELRAYGTSVNNSTVTLSATGGEPHPVTGVVTPGEYWINGDHIANPTNSMPIFMDLGGTGNTYNLSGATINLDTRKLDGFGRNLGHDSGVDVIQINGSSNTVQGITLIGQDIALDTDPNAQRYADWSTVYVELSGTNNTVDGAHVVARGSRTDTYGLSDAFGKGASQGIQPFIGHRKASNFRVGEATNAVVNNVHLETYSFGHNFFVQGSTNTTLTNSTIKAELFPSQPVIDRPEYQQYGHTWWGEPIPDDIMLAGSEGGVRVYGGSSGLTVNNVTVDGARTGFATVHDGGQVNINNAFAYNTTSGFDVGDNTTITNSGGNIVNGPLLVFYGSGNNTTIDLELTEGTPIGTSWTAAYFNGNADISISSDLAAEDLPEESYIRLGQSYFENWRDFDYNTAGPEDGTPTAFNNQTFVNDTNQIVVLGENATGNTGSSQGGVISNGKDNEYDGVTFVFDGTRLIAQHVNGLGNGGTADENNLDSNASIVYEGATLEVQAGIRIQDEKLTITGDGVDGKGALYSDGSNDSNTRFGSSNGSDESTVFLDGDSSIGVGTAGNRLLVGRIQGTGNLTKRGAGTLVIGKSSTYDGDLTVAEGHIIGRSGVVQNNLSVASGTSIGAIGGNMLATPDGVVQLDGILDLNQRTDSNGISGTIGVLNGSGRVTSSNPTAGFGGTLTLAGNGSSGAYAGTVDGAVSLIKSGGNTQSLGGGMTHTGSTTVNGGTLLINAAHTGGGVYTVNGGTLGGNGSIDSTVVVAAGGVLAPGTSAGEFTIADVQLQSNSTLQIEIGGTIPGTSHDRLTTDSISLGGDLSFSLIDVGGGQYAPYANDSFIVVSSDSLTGQFDNAGDGDRLDTAGGEGSFQVVYNDIIDSVILMNFIPSGLLGDYDANGTVDAADFTIWRDSMGQTGLSPFSGADGTGDGQINTDDYLVWKNNFGAIATTAVTSVPEPDGLLLALMAFLAPFSHRLRRRPSI